MKSEILTYKYVIAIHKQPILYFNYVLFCLMNGYLCDLWNSLTHYFSISQELPGNGNDLFCFCTFELVQMFCMPLSAAWNMLFSVDLRFLHAFTSNQFVISCPPRSCFYLLELSCSCQFLNKSSSVPFFCLRWMPQSVTYDLLMQPLMFFHAQEPPSLW